ncbi:LysR family transcriptional regulator [Cupriavidus sp. USMAA2-4]|uniref:LysR family transcriptional regulator n=1 Tax=Cupriavidus malaysiensis TaxID=367825 RepID=A0A1D9I005_9BURK|nr:MULTISPECIES: substrate-binding domain-containing protein [Cupriavidus]AOY91610.1 LysR family transcriptional regulator [Cupriavidus sp. USMAA2-4]AOY98840.1 LysR family transcriptional regulator [Cupriavidus sp. USMAHM13]AOZ05265.1 LysR family transcriptional regulator [Cupriavidus malaysiensis]
MLRIAIHPQLQLREEHGDTRAPLDISRLVALLDAIEASGSIRSSAESVELSYRYAWGILRDAEALFGGALIEKTRGRGSVLTPLAQQLVWASKRIGARLSPTLESLASELEIELDKLVRAADPAVRLHASHGFAVAALREFLDEHHVRHDLKYCGSLEAVAALASGGCDIAGFHVPVGEFEAPVLARFRAWLRADTHCLVHLAVRTQGLFVEAGNPRRIVGLEDLCRPGVRFVNRQEGSGTRLLLDLLLQARGIAPARIDGYRNGEFTHAAVAAYIGSGMADVGFGVETAARRFGLGFVPVLKERYFFAIEQKMLQTPALARAVSALRSDSFRERVDALPGYDATLTGTVLTLEQAFAGYEGSGG